MAGAANASMVFTLLTISMARCVRLMVPTGERTLAPERDAFDV